DPRPLGGMLPGVAGSPGGIVSPGPAGPGMPRSFASLSPTRAVTGVLPLRDWLRDGHQLRQEPGAPPGLLPEGPRRGAVLEVTVAGLWIRRPGNPPAWAGSLVRERSAGDVGPLITLGVPGERLTEQEWELARHLIRHLPGSAGGQLLIAADTEPADAERA